MKRLSVALVAITLPSLGCNTAKPDKTVQQPSPKAPTVVSTVAVVSRKLSTTVSLPAQLIPYESVDIFPKVTGFVERITVDRGSRVRRGQLLVLLTAPELISQRAQAASAVKAAQSQLATAQAKLASDNGGYLHMVSASKTRA